MTVYGECDKERPGIRMLGVVLSVGRCNRGAGVSAAVDSATRSIDRLIVTINNGLPMSERLVTKIGEVVKQVNADICGPHFQVAGLEDTGSPK